MTPHVGVVIITDGRAEYLAQMLGSLKLGGQVAYGPVAVIDDSADPLHWSRVGALLNEWNGNRAPIHVRHLERRGLAGAVQSAWRTMLATEVEYVLHLEEDFTFPEPVPVAEMVDVLRVEPPLAQVVLKRQPWSPEEMAAGGIIECHPNDYTDDRSGTLSWVEHSRVFSLNPCVYPRHVMAYGWPASNEAGFTADLVSRGHRFAFYGGREDPPRCVHIGARRSAAWAL